MDSKKNEFDQKEKQSLSPEQYHKKVVKSLFYSLFDGGFYSVMQGVTSSFLVPYAILLNASTLVLGILGTLPDLIATLFQFFTKKLFLSYFSRKKVIVFLAFLQALFWLPLLFLSKFTFLNSSYLLLFFLCFIAFCSAIISPLWNSLMLDLVPEHHRGTYFGKRNIITAIIAFVATLAGGLLLHQFSVENKFFGFSILFFIAALARLVSAAFLLKMYDPTVMVKNNFSFKKDFISFVSFIKHIRKESFGRFVLFVSLFHCSVYIAAPFFAVYMLKVLHFSYFEFTLITLASVLTSVIGMKIFGKYGDSSGSKNVLLICGFLIPFIPFLWLFTKNFYFLFLIESFSGFVWAGFNLSTSNYLYDCSTKDDILDHVSYFNLFHTLFLLFGSLLGGLMIDHLPFSSFGTNILFVLGLSALLRLLVAILFIPTLKEMRLIEVPLERGFFGKFVAIKHAQGFVPEIIGHYDKRTQQKKIDPHLLIHEKRHLFFSQDKNSILKEKDKDKNYYAKKSIQNLLKNVGKK